ncbi:EGT2 [Mytilus coruscus]|uniref:EGT2 n=1 Tax=Mytilus coruscus TaxID=42192 RepID=A0A6J8AUK5_MYTCO|nr:EGT2 [Mytilus coruscus]
MGDMPDFGKEMREKEFDLKDGVTFINHGSYGVVPLRVQEAQNRVLYEINSFPDLWFRINRRIKQDESLRLIAEFVNTETDDLVFVQNATTGVNTVLKSFKFDKGDVILCTDNTYAAIKNTCSATAELPGAKDIRVEYIDLKFPIVNEDEVVEMFREYFKNNPTVKLAVIDHITSPSAIRMPIEKLIPLCKEFGVLSLIDGAHAPGQIPLNLKELDADFYTGNFHKWLYTPRGCAILYVKRAHQDWVRPLVTSHGHKTTFQNDFFEQGTRDDSPYCVAPDALTFYKDIGGYDKIYGYVDDLLNKATNMLTTSWKTEKLQIPRSMEAPFMRMVRLPKLKGLSSGTDSNQYIVDTILKYRIVVATVFIDDDFYCRLSANIYNTILDYQALCHVHCNRMSTI